MQVCPPALHTTLGIFQRLFNLLEKEFHLLDLRVTCEDSADHGGATYHCSSSETGIYKYMLISHCTLLIRIHQLEVLMEWQGSKVAKVVELSTLSTSGQWRKPLKMIAVRTASSLTVFLENYSKSQTDHFCLFTYLWYTHLYLHLTCYSLILVHSAVLLFTYMYNLRLLRDC